MEEIKNKVGSLVEEIFLQQKEQQLLQEKINTIQQDIIRKEEIIKKIMEERKLYEVYDSSRFIYTTFNVEKRETFNSSGLKKDDPLIYESCRVVSKRFDSKIVKKKYPDIYKNYIQIIESKRLLYEVAKHE